MVNTHVLGLGPEGSYTSQVMRSVTVDNSPKFTYSKSNIETIRGLKGADFGVLPVYNKYGGIVAANMEAIFDVTRKRTVKVLGWYDLSIRHVLASIGGTTIDDVHAVFSHPQALRQCETKLKPMPISQTATPSTTYKVSTLQEGEAVICSPEAAEASGLEILDPQFCPEDNTTEFALLTSHRNFDISKIQNTYGDKTIAILKAKPRVLLKAFGALGDFDLGLNFTEGVPNKRGGLMFPSVLTGIGSQKSLIGEKVRGVGGDIQFL